MTGVVVGHRQHHVRVGTQFVAKLLEHRFGLPRIASELDRARHSDPVVPGTEHVGLPPREHVKKARRFVRFSKLDQYRRQTIECFGVGRC